MINNDRIRIAASLRKRCGIQVRDHVLLAGTSKVDLLVVYTLSALEQALAAMHTADAEVGR